MLKRWIMKKFKKLFDSKFHWKWKISRRLNSISCESYDSRRIVQSLVEFSDYIRVSTEADDSSEREIDEEFFQWKWRNLSLLRISYSEIPPAVVYAIKQIFEVRFREELMVRDGIIIRSINGSHAVASKASFIRFLNSKIHSTESVSGSNAFWKASSICWRLRFIIQLQSVKKSSTKAHK